MLNQINRVGEKHISNKGEEFTIIEYFNSINVSIRFNDGTIINNKHYNNIKSGKITNPNTKTIYNIGFIGEGKYSHKIHTKSYITWHNMIKRCYSIKNHLISPTYIDCTVDERWHNFQVFAEWFENNYIDGFQLDKDILLKGNKIYSPETCCFVPQEINGLFVKANKIRGKYPVGITKRGKLFWVQINKYNEQFTYGGFVTIEEAFECYKLNKEAYIKYVANIWKPHIQDNIYQILIKYRVEITD